MRFDAVLRHIGEFGIYQKWIYFLVCIPGITHGIRMMISAFIQFVPEHRCAIPGYDNDTYEVQSEYHQKLINESIPYHYVDDEYKPRNCFAYSGGNYSYNEYNMPINASIMGCSRWVYDKSVFTDTATVKLNMVCDDAILRSHAQMAVQGGFLVGVFLLGAVSDKFGRKVSFFVALIINIIGGFSLVVAPEFYSYIFLRFMNGGSSAGVFTASYIMGVELTGPSKRLWTGLIIKYHFAIGMLLLCMVGYFVRDWVLLEIIVTAPILTYMAFYCIVPESPRWLITKQRTKEAKVILEKIAKVNKTKLPPNLQLENDDDNKIGQFESFKKLFTTPLLLFRTSIIFFNWMIVAMTYYGLSLNTNNLGAGNFFLNFFIGSLMDFPAVTICLLLIDRIGRKKLHCGFMLMGGVCTFCTIFTILYMDKDQQWITVMLAMIGKMGSAAGFGVVYVYSAELYPTTVRTAAFGASSACARIGSMLAPYIVDGGIAIGGDFGRAFPLMMFGGLSATAGLLCLLLPETLKKDLPENIIDGERLGLNQSISVSEDDDEVKEKPDLDENGVSVVDLKFKPDSNGVTSPDDTNKYNTLYPEFTRL